ncbi:mechanosensitive ion channel [Candidatus Woesearchaeota archaeon]|nr:mechanosensitive ion channel [Candidatus Woesearchaeota archaeon]
MNFDINGIYNLVVPYLPKLAIGLIVLIVGWFICGFIASFFSHIMKKAKVEDSLRTFLRSLIRISLKIVLIITVASMVGIEMTSFIAILAAAGFAVGMALQGSLSNFAGGVLILFFKPFKVGDTIEGQGYTGKVKEIQIFNTVLKTPDNKTIIIPNGSLSNGSITNFSTEKNRRLDMVFGIGYKDNVEKAKKIIMELVKKDKRIFSDPEHFLRVTQLNNSSVDITLRVWCESKDLWDINFDMLENVKHEFDKNRISIPYPQMDIHMKRM